MMPWRVSLCRSLPSAIADALLSLSRTEAAGLTEIRARVGRPISWVFTGGVRESGEVLSREFIEELVNALCGYSRYAFEAQMAKGYIALPGGHRAGVCGRVVYEEGAIVRMSSIRSVCIRIARRIEGACAPYRDALLIGGQAANVLLMGPPGCGKTTALRDAAAYLARDCRLNVAVADEREELFSGWEAAEADVMRGAKKADAMRMLTRSMAPQVLVTDEIGSMEDAHALLDAASCGVGILASAHAAGMTDVFRRPALRLLFERRIFDRYIRLGEAGVCLGVWDAKGNAVTEGTHGQLGSGGDGADWNQCDRLSSCRG